MLQQLNYIKLILSDIPSKVGVIFSAEAESDIEASVKFCAKHRVKFILTLLKAFVIMI